MKKQRGITLIALIITIVVMLILVGVTVNYTVGENGILNSAKEAKFKQEVTHIIEAVEIEKKAALVENKGTTPDSYDTVRLENAIPNSLKTKYLDSGKLSISADGNLYYNEANLVGNEKQWLEDLGITAQDAGEEPFVNDFDIDLSQEALSLYNNTKVRITIKPDITDKWNMPEKFTEETAVPIVASYFEYDGRIDSADNISTLEQLDVAIYNKLITMDTPLKGLKRATVFYSKDEKDGIVSLQTEVTALDASYADITPQQFFALTTGSETVEELAAEKYSYTPTNYSMKIAKGTEEFVDITDEVNWNGLIYIGATYNVTTNGTYTIQLELEGKKSRNTIEVTEVYVELTEEEELQEAIKRSYEINGEIDLAYLRFTLVGWTTSIDNNLLRCKKNNGTTEYVVTEQGKIEKAILTTEEVLEKLQIAQTEGKYQGEWEVIGIDGENLKYVSKESVTQISNSSGTQSAFQDRTRYINSVSVLNTAAEEATGITGAKSITVQDICDILGENNINQGVSNLYKFTYDETKQTVIRTLYGGELPSGETIWANPTETLSKGEYLVHDDGEIQLINSDPYQDKEGTINAIVGYGHEFTAGQIEKLHSLSSTDSYWFATPIVLTDCYVKSTPEGQPTEELLGKLAYCLACFENGKLARSTWATDGFEMSLSILKGVRAVISL